VTEVAVIRGQLTPDKKISAVAKRPCDVSCQ